MAYTFENLIPLLGCFFWKYDKMKSKLMNHRELSLQLNRMKVRLQFRKQFGILSQPPHAQEIKTVATMEGLMDKE